MGCCILEGTSQETYCWISVDYTTIGMNLLKESEISVPQPKDLFIHFCHFIFNCNLICLFYITPTTTNVTLFLLTWCLKYNFYNLCALVIPFTFNCANFGGNKVPISVTPIAFVLFKRYWQNAFNLVIKKQEIMLSMTIGSLLQD